MNQNTHSETRADFLFEEPPHVMIVEARFYEDIADHLAQGATEVLKQVGASYERHTVPGSLELPAAIQFAVRGLDFYTARRRFDAYIALGCVIRGETSHYEIVSENAARGLMDLSLRYTLAIGNGILTCENHVQAVERARPDGHNVGGRAAVAALQLLSIKNLFGIFPRK